MKAGDLYRPLLRDELFKSSSLWRGEQDQPPEPQPVPYCAFEIEDLTSTSLKSVFVQVELRYHVYGRRKTYQGKVGLSYF